MSMMAFAGRRRHPTDGGQPNKKTVPLEGHFTPFWMFFLSSAARSFRRWDEVVQRLEGLNRLGLQSRARGGLACASALCCTMASVFRRLSVVPLTDRAASAIGW